MGLPQVVRVGNNTSAMLILNTGAPQGCVLSPLLYSLFTHDCTAKHDSNTIIKFADDTTVVGLITDNEMERDLTVWCQDNNLCLNDDQDKGDDRGLLEKEDRACPHSHKQGCSGTD